MSLFATTLNQRTEQLSQTSGSRLILNKEYFVLQLALILLAMASFLSFHYSFLILVFC